MNRKNVFLGVLIALVLGLVAFIYYNFNEASNLKKANIDLKKKVKSLEFENKIKAFKITEDSLKMVALAVDIEVLKSSDTINKKKLKTINHKYESLKYIYYNSSTIAKDSIFSALIHN